MRTGEKIAICRKNHRLSQEDLASQLGISRQAVSRWETGETMPDCERIIQLSRLFGVSTDYLLLEERQTPDPTDGTGTAAALPAAPAEDAAEALRRRFRIGLGIALTLSGILIAITALILAALEAAQLTAWVTHLGRFGTALLESWRLPLLVIGGTIALIGICVLVNEYWKLERTR